MGLALLEMKHVLHVKNSGCSPDGLGNVGTHFFSFWEVAFCHDYPSQCAWNSGQPRGKLGCAEPQTSCCRSRIFAEVLLLFSCRVKCVEGIWEGWGKGVLWHGYVLWTPESMEM